MDFVHCHSIIEQPLALVSKMSQTVPLAADLGIENPDVIIHNARRFPDKNVLKQCSIEKGGTRARLERKRSVEGDSGKY